MSQYNKLSDIQYARFQILLVDLHFGLFWSAGIPTMKRRVHVDYSTIHHGGPPQCNIYEHGWTHSIKDKQVTVRILYRNTTNYNYIIVENIAGNMLISNLMN